MRGRFNTKHLKELCVNRVSWENFYRGHSLVGGDLHRGCQFCFMFVSTKQHGKGSKPKLKIFLLTIKRNV